MKVIKYGEPVTEEEVDLIYQVFKDNVQCANEVFIEELPGNSYYDEQKELIVIGSPEDGDEFVQEINL